LPAQQNFNSNEDTVDNTIQITQDTVTFREDGDTSTDQYSSNMRTLPKTLYDTVGDSTKRDIHDFLRRPIILSQGTWDTTQLSTISLGSWTFPDAMFNSAYADQITRKILGFTLMKAKIRLRLQVNSQPSYAGILLMSYVPHADYMVSKVNSLYSTLTSLTGCTHVTMNLANNTSMEFLTPYISQHLFANLVTGQGTFGKMNLQVLSPLTIGAGIATPVTWTLWANFEDVELRFPTSGAIAPAFAQIGGEATTLRKTGMISGAVGTVGSVISKTLPALGLGALSQPVEALASSVSGIARFFGFSKPTNTPTIQFNRHQAFRGHLNMDGVDTCIKLGASVATELQTLSGFAGTDEDEMNLSYIVSRPSAIDAVIWKSVGSTSQQDQVLATYRCTPLALCWNSNNVTPALARVRNVEVRNTHAAFIADKYHMWRGDIVYTFHFAKTQLHSGRLRVNFKPYVGDIFPGTSQNLNNVPGFTMTEDIDLAATSSFRFRVPYVSSRPWMLTQWPQWNAPIAATVDAKNFSIGEVELVILNKLTSMSTVNPDVNIVVFAHMENAQFAVPRRSSTLPNLLAAPAAMLAASTPIEDNKIHKLNKRQKPIGVSDSNELDAIAQIGGEEAKTMTETQRADSVDILPGAMCQGEVHTSLRQLLKRFELISYVAPSTSFNPNAGAPGTDADWYTIRPWAPMTAVVNNGKEWALNTTDATNLGRRFADTYSAVYGNYAFFRGSMRFRIYWDQISDPTTGIANLGSQGLSIFLVYPKAIKPSLDVTWTRAEEHPLVETVTMENNDMRPHPAVSANWNTNSLGATGPPLIPVSVANQREDLGWEAVSFINLEGGAEFEVPYYSTGHMSTARYFSYSGDFWQAQRDGQIPLPLVVFGGNFMNIDRFRVYRAVGDDFSFGGLLGVPRSTKVLEIGPQSPNTDSASNQIQM